MKLPPTQAELPYDDGIPMETQRHKFQMDMLIDTLCPWLEARSDGYVSGNMFVYFSLAQLKNQDFRGPDFFAVLGVPKKERLSWVVWEEGKPPDVVIELLSESTASQDKNEKKLIYQNLLRVPEYFWFDPFHPEDLAGFSLNRGVYQPITPNAENQLVSQSLGLALVRWTGSYRGVETT
ncbi:Uma2 family endonuclease [Anabaena azotica]|uniref:Uma2 family endonuclease n=1 Tax=Anabaena azotica TaxID=197653 RepID=UPI0039A64944